jgi:hypothetical protein
LISSAKLSGTGLVISGTGGTANWPYVVLIRTNLIAGQWLPIATNQFDASGNFSFTNSITPGLPRAFYQLQLQ